MRQNSQQRPLAPSKQQPALTRNTFRCTLLLPTTRVCPANRARPFTVTAGRCGRCSTQRMTEAALSNLCNHCSELPTPGSAERKAEGECSSVAKQAAWVGSGGLTGQPGAHPLSRHAQPRAAEVHRRHHSIHALQSERSGNRRQR